MSGFGNGFSIGTSQETTINNGRVTNTGSHSSFGPRLGGSHGRLPPGNRFNQRHGQFPGAGPVSVGPSFGFPGFPSAGTGAGMGGPFGNAPLGFPSNGLPGFSGNGPPGFLGNGLPGFPGSAPQPFPTIPDGSLPGATFQTVISQFFPSQGGIQAAPNAGQTQASMTSFASSTTLVGNVDNSVPPPPYQEVAEDNKAPVDEKPRNEKTPADEKPQDNGAPADQSRGGNSQAMVPQMPGQAHIMPRPQPFVPMMFGGQADLLLWPNVNSSIIYSQLTLPLDDALEIYDKMENFFSLGERIGGGMSEFTHLNSVHFIKDEDLIQLAQGPVDYKIYQDVKDFHKIHLLDFKFMHISAVNRMMDEFFRLLFGHRRMIGRTPVAIPDMVKAVFSILVRMRAICVVGKHKGDTSASDVFYKYFGTHEIQRQFNQAYAQFGWHNMMTGPLMAIHQLYAILSTMPGAANTWSFQTEMWA